ncbi:MAG: barstar family protein [Rhodocyclales bacterium]|nr:barstar family protein [Rhodocyclales bacterium]
MSREQYEGILRDIARAGVYHMPQQGMGDLLAAAEAAGFAICRIDLAMVRDKTALFERLAIAFEFPDWFGHNWDALADCLGDLSWITTDGYLLVLEHCDGFRASQAEDFATALQVFAAAAAAWREDNVPFWILVDMHADGIAYLPGLG